MLLFHDLSYELHCLPQAEDALETAKQKTKAATKDAKDHAAGIASKVRSNGITVNMPSSTTAHFA